MVVYELIQCELDSLNHISNEQRVGFFDSTNSIINYLTHNGQSHAKLSMLNHSEADHKYMEEYMESPNLTLVLHHDAYKNPLIGLEMPEYDLYYYVRKHEVKSCWNPHCPGFSSRQYWTTRNSWIIKQIASDANFLLFSCVIRNLLLLLHRNQKPITFSPRHHG